MTEDTKLEENVGCGVSTGHSGRAKIAHMECMHSAGQDARWPIGSLCWLNTDDLYAMAGTDRTLAEDKRFDEYVGGGIGRGHSGRYKMAHRECLFAEDRCPITSGRRSSDAG